LHYDATRGGDPKSHWFHTFDDAMTVRGVHGTKTRRQCKAEFKKRTAAGLPLEGLLEKYGTTVPPEDLSQPDHVYPLLLAEYDLELVEQWVTMALDAAHWHQRASFFEAQTGYFLARKIWSKDPPEGKRRGGNALCHILTATLEHLPDKHIGCIQAAAFYALSLHPQWASAGVNWLSPIKSTWLADWLKEHPHYRELARLCRTNNPDLPAWISGDRT
jgi:hypothetical protein